MQRTVDAQAPLVEHVKSAVEGQVSGQDGAIDKRQLVFGQQAAHISLTDGVPAR